MYTESFQCDTCGREIETGFYFRSDDSEPWRNTFNGDTPDEGDDLLCQTCHRENREASE